MSPITEDQARELIADAFQEYGFIVPCSFRNSLCDCIQDERELTGKIYLYFDRPGDQSTHTISREAN